MCLVGKFSKPLDNSVFTNNIIYMEVADRQYFILFLGIFFLW